jgi:hypothetical protein
MTDVVYRLRQHDLKPIHGNGEYFLAIPPIDIGNIILIPEAMEVENNFVGSTIGNYIITLSSIQVHHPIQKWKWVNKKRVTELVTLRGNFRTHQNNGDYTIIGFINLITNISPAIRKALRSHSKLLNGISRPSPVHVKRKSNRKVIWKICNVIGPNFIPAKK